VSRDSVNSRAYRWLRSMFGGGSLGSPLVVMMSLPGVRSFVPVTLEAVGECFRVRFSERAVVEIPAGDSATLLRVVEQLAAADSGKGWLS